MKKIYILLCISSLIFGNLINAQSTLYQEDFGTATDFPTGWTADPNWSIATTGSSDYPGASGGSQARTSSAAGNLIYQSVNTENFENISVAWGARRTSTQAPVVFEWSIDGTTWNPVTFTDVAADSDWALVNNGNLIQLPTGAEHQQNLSFRWSVSSGGTYRIDDFLVTGVSSTGIPQLLTTESEFENLNYIVNEGPSDVGEFLLSGSDLDGSTVSLTLGNGDGSDFEISQSSTSGFTDEFLVILGYGGSALPIYVRLKEGLALGDYSEVLVIEGGGAPTLTIDLSGQVLTNLVSYEFTGETVEATQSNMNLSASDFELSDGGNVLFGSTGPSDWSGSGVPYAQGNTGWDGNNIADAKSFVFSLDASPDYKIGLSNISFDWRVTGAGPSAITVEVNGSVISTFDAIDDTTLSFSESLSGFDDLTEVEVRIKGWDNGSRTTTGGGQFRVNDVRLDGRILLSKTFTFAGGAWSPENPSDLSTISDFVEVLDGDATILGDLIAKELTIFSNSSLSLSANSVLNVSEQLDNNGTLIFSSNSDGSAQFDEFTGVYSGTGTVQVERYLPSKRAFWLLSSPVGGQSIADAWQQDTHITGAGGATNGFDLTQSNNPSMFTFDNTLADQSGRAAWTAVDNTSEVITAGTPYRLFVRGDRGIDLANNAAPATPTTLKASGAMQVGDFSPVLSNEPNNFSFVGNPYQAVVDFFDVNTSNLTGFIYVWDPFIAGENGNGGYVTVDITGLTSPSPSSSNASEFIEPGQAFFVQNTSAGNGSITFEEKDKFTFSGLQPLPPILEPESNTSEVFYINSRLYKTQDYQTSSLEADAIGLRFNENYTTKGSDEDASKLANPGENYAVVNNGFRAIDKQNLPKSGHEVQLTILNYQASDYSLSFDVGNPIDGLEVYLIDSYLGTTTRLNSEVVYSFTVDTNIAESVDAERFKLKFEQSTLSNDAFEVANISLYPNPVQGVLNIALPANVELNSVKLYDMLGQRILSSKEDKLDLSGLSSGVYFVELETEAGSFTKKIIKE